LGVVDVRGARGAFSGFVDVRGARGAFSGFADVRGARGAFSGFADVRGARGAFSGFADVRGARSPTCPVRQIRMDVLDLAHQRRYRDRMRQTRLWRSGFGAWRVPSR